MEDKVFVTKYHKKDVREYIEDGFLKIRFGNLGEYSASGEDHMEGYGYSSDQNPSAIIPKGQKVLFDEVELNWYDLVCKPETVLYCSSERNSRFDIVDNMRIRKEQSYRFVFYFDKSKLSVFNRYLAMSLEDESGLYGKLASVYTNVQYVESTELTGFPFMKRDIPIYTEEREIRHMPVFRDSVEKSNGEGFDFILNTLPIFTKIPIQNWMKFGEIRDGKLIDIKI